MAKDEKGTVYVLSISLNKQKYYVIDLEGSLSRSLSDSMLENMSVDFYNLAQGEDE